MKPNRAAACRFFSHGQAVLMAIEAYTVAARAVEPPQGQCWFDELGNPWSSYTDWAQHFLQAVQQQIERCAIAQRIPFESGSVYPELYWSIEGQSSTPENAQFATPDNRPDNQAQTGVGND
jgi:hypothetical protein